jgi:hypothetical protein
MASEYLESLEPRALFAAITLPTVSVSSRGTLTISGTPQADQVELQLVHDDPKKGYIGTITGGSPKTTVNIREKFTKVKRIVIDTGGGKDSITIEGVNFTKPVTLLGGAGNDRINYSASFAPIFASGGGGNDVVGASAAVELTSSRNRDVINSVFAQQNKTAIDTIIGGAGNDTLSGDTNDLIDGGSGKDVAALVVISADTPEARRDALSELYYQRLGAVSTEQFLGFNLLNAAS